MLETQRLVLSTPNNDDIPTIVKYAGDERIAKTTERMPHPYYEKDAQTWINMTQKGLENGTAHIFAIRLKAGLVFIGGIGLEVNHLCNHGELGYWVATPYWNQGYATEAARRVLQFGFEELALHKIFAQHMVCNPSSRKVMQKIGMIEEGRLKDHFRKGEEYHTLAQYRLTRDEYEEVKRRSE